MTDVKNPGGLLAPFSQEAEEATLGAVLTSGMIYEDLASFLSADSFYLTRHRYLWETFARLHKDRLIIDMTTVSEDLRQRLDPSSKTPLLEIIGGYAYIVHLINNTPNSMHAEAYGRLVERTATRRKLLMAADTIRTAALDEGKHIDTVLNDSEQAVFQASNGHLERRGEWVDKSSQRVWDAMYRLYAGTDTGTGLKTGFDNLDGMLRGLEAQDLIVLAARPGMGKTSLLLAILLNLALRDIPVGMFTMEMSTDRLTSRLYALLSGVSTTKQKTRGACTPDDVKALRKARETLAHLPIHITDEPSPTPRQILTVAQRLVNREGVQALFVDGIYRMSPDHDTKGDDTKAYSQIAMGLKTMARSLRVPLVATHQLNRDLEKRPDKRPLLSDLRQSGRIEEEADIVMFLYRDVVYNEHANPCLAEAIFAKNRDGGVGKSALHFEASLTKFSDADVSTFTLGGGQ